MLNFYQKNCLTTLEQTISKAMILFLKEKRTNLKLSNTFLGGWMGAMVDGWM
jgi:hypothetical protein